MKWFVSFGILLLLLAGGFFFFYAKPIEVESAQNFGSKEVDPQIQTLVVDFSQKKPIERLIGFYESEAKRIGQIDDDPAQTQKRLESVASVLSLAELEWLKKQAIDRTLDGDARFFAVYLLALNASDDSLTLLESIAVEAVPQSKNKGIVELEVQIRAQAIEGISRVRKNTRARDILLDLIDKQENVFLQDRAHRALYGWETGSSPEEQDKDALKKVLYK
ncbi:MAG: hypothetical protein M9962_10255 [Oligoflexia bacterium]|nr:hypothetical protein [Oligoflexia bacterium]